jgi:hypothetical protein
MGKLAIRAPHWPRWESIRNWLIGAAMATVVIASVASAFSLAICAVHLFWGGNP